MQLKPLKNDSFDLPRWTLTVYVAICCLLFAMLAAIKGIPNWDMLGYVASIPSASDVQAYTLHEQIYSAAAAYLSAADYAELVGKDSYRQAMAASSELFYLQIPYYKIRWLFLALISVLGSIGVHVFAAGHIIAASAAALAGFLLFCAFNRSVTAYFWLLFPLLFALSGALETARIYSPDALSLLVFALAFYSYVHRHWSFFLVMALAVFVRTDLLVLVMLCTAFIFVFRPSLRLPALVSCVLALGFYLFINHSSGNHGWSAVHYFVFESNMQAVDPRVFVQYSVSPAAYFGAIFSALPTLFYYPALIFFLFSAGLSAVLMARLFECNTGFWQAVKVLCADCRFVAIVISLMYIGAHFALFPLLDTRFFAGPYFITSLCALSLISEVLDRTDLTTKA